MNVFEEQLKKRLIKDEKAFRKSFIDANDALSGRRVFFDEVKSDEAIKDILRYFNKKDYEEIIINDKCVSVYDKVEAYCKPYGIMYRTVLLDDDWYKKATGTILGFKNDGTSIAIIDKGWHYVYYDGKKKKYVNINKKNVKLFKKEAICFYNPLPQRKLTIVDLIKYAIPTWSIMDFALIFIFTGITTFLGLFMPALTYFILHYVIDNARITLLFSTVFFMLCVTFSSIFINIIKNFVTNSLNTKLNMYLEAAVMNRLLSLPVNFYRKFSSGDIVQRASNINSLCSQIISMCYGTTLISIFSIMYIFQIFLYAKVLVIPAIVTTIILVIVQIIFTLVQIQIAERIMIKSSKNYGMTYSTIAGIHKIKLAGAEKRMFARWMKNYIEEFKDRYFPPFIIKYLSTITLAVTLMGQFVMYVVALNAHISVDAYYAFTMSYAQVVAAFMGVTSIVTFVAEIKPMITMIKPVMEVEPESYDNKKQIIDVTGKIEFSRVSFSYSEDNNKVLNNISFVVNKGEYVAIVGKTGCGKSTIVRLLLGFEKPDKGSIYVDNNDISNVDIRSLRSKIGTVMQDGKLFQGSIFYNISITNPKISVDEAWEAAEIADIANDIHKLPMGMHTIISEGQGGVSGGQKQRLMIARAMASKPKIIVFDEATSSLDNVSQKRVSEAIDKLDCTRIVIAHRLSTIKNCDRILFIDDGRIAEEGNYEELINKKGKFYELIRRQKLDEKE